jgi:hypothetical protein
MRNDPYGLRTERPMRRYHLLWLTALGAAAWAAAIGLGYGAFLLFGVVCR